VFTGHAQRFGALGLWCRRLRGPRTPEPAQQQRVVAVRAERVPRQRQQQQQQQLRRHAVRRPATRQPGPVLGQHAVPGPAGHDGSVGPIATRPRLSRAPAQQARGRLVRDEPGHGRTPAAGRRVRHRRNHGIRSPGSPAASASAPTATAATAAAAAADRRRRGRGDCDKSRATVHATSAFHQLTQEVSV